jgi:hypothetical protein
MTDNEPRWVHDCSRCGVSVPSDRCEETCPVCQVAMAAEKAEPAPACVKCLARIEHGDGELCQLHAPPMPVSLTPDELARKQRVVDAIGQFLAKPAKPTTFRRWRRPGFR